ncbi:hypothetical protein BGX27_003758, partial [Mortierella sp. AM989]
DTPRKVAEPLLSLGEAHPPIDGSTSSQSSQASTALKTAQKSSSNPSLSSAQPSVCYDTRSNNRRRWPSRSKEEKHEALEIPLAWRKVAHEKWVSDRPYRVGAETGILPDYTAKLLSQKFSQIRSAEAVAAFASSCYWMPRGGDIWFGEIAEILGKLNNEIDARRRSGSETTAASVLAQPKDDSERDGEGNGEEDLPFSN